jgi:hypothetical protein
MSQNEKDAFSNPRGDHARFVRSDNRSGRLAARLWYNPGVGAAIFDVLDTDAM